MLKIIKDCKDKFRLVLEGEIKVDHSKLKPYEQYVKEEEALQIREQIENYLKQILPNPYDGSRNGDCYALLTHRESYGYSCALKDLTKYLTESIDK